MISISEPYTDNLEIKFLKQVLNKKNFTDGFFQKSSENLISRIIKKKVFLTQSCSSALEVSAILLNLKKGDEVLVPSYTFSSTVNAIVHRSAKPIFVDVDKETLCMDIDDLEKKITKKTKAIYLVHYGGNSSDVEKLLKLKKKHSIYLVEDAAHAFLSKYKKNYLGTIGDIGTFSFHETKNFNGAQCGAIVINNKKFLKNIEIILDKGTDRKEVVDFKKRFLAKNKRFYSWKNLGSEYRASELSSAILLAQLKKIKKLQDVRKKVYLSYKDFFDKIDNKKCYQLKINRSVKISYHLFCLIFFSVKEANKFKKFMIQNKIAATFHYVPLHSSTFGRTVSAYKKLPVTESIYLKVVRLPLHSNINQKLLNYILKILNLYFSKKN